MEMKVRALLGSFVMLSTMWLAGCGHYICGNTFGSATCSSSGGGISQGGGGNGAGFKARFYFVDFAQAGSTGGMAETELNGTAGTFSAITTFTAPALPTQPTGLVIVNKKFMYVPSANGILVGYAIDMTTGFVKEVPNSPYAIVGGTSIASNSTGTLIFVGDVTGQRIFVFAVNADGSLTAVAGSPFSTSGVRPAVMAADGHSKFLYITEGAGSPLIAAFSIGTNGTLSVVPGEPFSFNMSSIVGDPSGKYLLGVTGQAADNHIHVFGISSSTGAIAEVSGSPFSTAFTPISLAVHPNGGWVYSFNEDVLLQLPDPVEGFQLNATTGTLTEFASSPFTSVKANGGVIEPSGKYLFALGATIIVGNGESTVTPYTVDSSGHLSSPLSSLGFPGIKAAAYAATDAQ